MEETRENISESIEELKVVLGEKYKDLRLPPDGDDILERSLRHRNFNINQAADQVHAFFKLFAELSKRNKDAFVPSSYKSYFFDSFAMGLFKRKDMGEQPIVFLNFDIMPVETLCIDKLLTIVILMLNELTSESTHVQNMGVVAVANLKGFQFEHVKKFSLSRLQTVAKIVQGSLPVRFKAIHVLNAPSIFGYTFALLKPFLRKKIKDRFHFHYSDLTELNKILDRNFLPVAFGGDLSTEENADDEFVEKLCAKDDYYQELVQYGYSRHVVQDS